MQIANGFSDTLAWLATLVVLFLFLLPQVVKIMREYERAVVFRLGKFHKVKGPGLILLIPFIDKIERVDLRVLTINVERQEVITKDNVTVNVDAIVFFRVMDAEKAIIQVERYMEATTWLAQTTLRSIVGQVELDELLAERKKINQKIQGIIDRQTDPWGIKVVSVEVRDVVLPENMKRAMARQAETERDRRAKVINARGEFQAAEQLVAAARMMQATPIALQLRYLQTMSEVSEENATFALLPLPMDILEAFKAFGGMPPGDVPDPEDVPGLEDMDVDPEDFVQDEMESGEEGAGGSESGDAGSTELDPDELDPPEDLDAGDYPPGDDAGR